MAKASSSKAMMPSNKLKRPPAERPEKASKHGGGKAAKLRPAGLSAVVKGKQRASDVQEKPKLKRKREQDAGDQKKRSRSAPLLIRSVKRELAPSAVRSWRRLSRGGQAELRATLDEAALDILSQLEGKAKADLQVLLREVYDEIDDYLSELLVPMPDASSRLALSSATKGEVDLISTDTIAERTASAAYDAALAPELAEIHALEREIKREQKLLEEDETRLFDFERARQNVEAAERKESSKNMHPLLRGMLDSRFDPPLESVLFNRKHASSAWIVNSARASLPKEKPAHLRQDDDDDDEAMDEQSEAEYDPTKDDYLTSLAQRIGGPLAEVEKRLEQLRRIEKLVDDGEKAVVGMM